MPEVTNKEEETKDEVMGSQPRTGAHIVHSVDFSCHTTHRVQRTDRRVGHEFSRTAGLPRLNIILELVEIKTIGATSRLKPRCLHIPEAHGFTTEDDFTRGRAHQVFTQTGWALGLTDVGTQALVTDNKGEGLRLRSFRLGWAIKFAGVNGVVEPDVARCNEAHQRYSGKAVGKIGFTRPDQSPTCPAKGLGENVPDTATDADQTDVDVTTDHVFEVVNTDDPTFAAQR